MLSVNDCLTLKNDRECSAILANPYFRRMFSNFERRYLGNRLSHIDQQDIIRKLWSSSTNDLFKILAVNDWFYLEILGIKICLFIWILKIQWSINELICSVLIWWSCDGVGQLFIKFITYHAIMHLFHNNNLLLG